jgi:hypothetical protein
VSRESRIFRRDSFRIVFAELQAIAQDGFLSPMLGMAIALMH